MVIVFGSSYRLNRPLLRGRPPKLRPLSRLNLSYARQFKPPTELGLRKHIRRGWCTARFFGFVGRDYEFSCLGSLRSRDNYDYVGAPFAIIVRYVYSTQPQAFNPKPPARTEHHLARYTW